jgi:hypothetical protein
MERQRVCPSVGNYRKSSLRDMVYGDRRMNERLLEILPDIKAIAWDTCHKIYVLMDDKRVELMGNTQTHQGG